MALWRVEIVRKAEKEYAALPSIAKKRIKTRILSLETNSRPSGSRKLKETDYFRLRSGDYRIVYNLVPSRKLVKILSIAHRKEVYRQLNK